MYSRQHYEDLMNYHSDPRVRAAEDAEHRSHIERPSDRKGFMQLCILVDADNAEGYAEQWHEMPTKFEVCSTCKGHGTVVNPSVDAGGLSRDDFEQDPDFKRDYFSGAYDIACTNCKGKRVIEVIDPDRFDQHQREVWEKHLKEERERDEFRRIQDAERRMGA